MWNVARVGGRRNNFITHGANAVSKFAEAIAKSAAAKELLIFVPERSLNMLSKIELGSFMVITKTNKTWNIQCVEKYNTCVPTSGILTSAKEIAERNKIDTVQNNRMGGLHYINQNLPHSQHRRDGSHSCKTYKTD